MTVRGGKRHLHNWVPAKARRARVALGILNLDALVALKTIHLNIRRLLENREEQPKNAR